MKKLISDEYRSMNRALHELPRYGTQGHKFADYIYRLIINNDVKTTLDYGCGKGTLKAALRKLGLTCRVYEYDPAVPGRLKCPEEVDLVVCTDVLEHVEPDYLDNVISHIARIGKKAAFITVHNMPAAKTLADGRNAHLIQETPEWWSSKLSDWFNVQQQAVDYRGEGSSIYRTRFLLTPRGRDSESP